MSNILGLWTVPHAKAEGLELMMRQRGDLLCYHEPFGAAWHQGESPLWRGYRKGDKTVAGLTLDSVLVALDQQSRNRDIFVKDLPLYVSHMLNREILGLFRHTFLIRDPAKVILSLNETNPDFDEADLGYDALRKMFDRVTDNDAYPPTVIDSDDLAADPVGTLSAWCAAAGLPFMPEALTWGVTPPRTPDWWDAGSVLDAAKTAGGLIAEEPVFPALNTLPSRATNFYLRAKTVYDHMSQYKLRG